MQKAVFLIKSHYEITKTIGYLNTHHSNAIADGKPLVVRIDQKQDDRSKAQNRLYWRWVSIWAKHQGTSKDYEHLFFKRTLLARIFNRDDVEYRKTYASVKQLKIEGHPLYQQLADSVTMLTSTTDATTEQFIEYLNDIHDFCLKNGKYLDTPDDLKYVLEY